MKSNKSAPIKNRCTQGFLVFVFLLMASLQIAAQEIPTPAFQPTDEEIAQGRNKGVTTWEGTLFGQDSYKPGSYVQIEVVPNPGFEFEHWEGVNIGNTTEAKTFVTMSDHAEIKAHYKRIWNVIAAPDNKEAGAVKGGGNYPEGTEVKLSVEPNDGFKFLGWEGKGINEEEKEELETSIIVEGDHDIVARFENENQDQNSGGGGGDSNENQDQNEDQNENQDQQDQQDQGEDEQDQGDQEEQPQQPESGEDDPAEPEEGDDEEQEQGDQGDEEEQPQPPGGEEEAPAQEAPAESQPIPLQMTPEEATRLLEAMEDGEKKLPLFIVTPPDSKKDTKKDW